MGLRTKFMRTVLAGLLFVPSVAPTASAQNEGIKVHGDWVIEVRNPDGTLASRAEFQNALEWPGGVALARLLARDPVVPGRWQIRLTGYQADPCGVGNNSSRPCLISEPGSHPGAPSYSDVDWSQNLVVTRTDGVVQLSGSIVKTPTGGRSITSVSTFVELCSGAGAGAVCTWSPFTRHSQNSPAIALNLQPGQIIQVTVRISFS